MSSILDEQVRDDGLVPLVGLGGAGAGSDDPTIAREVGRACRDVGFLVVAEHGVPAELVERMDRVTRWLFEQPQERRRLLAPDPADPMQRGYSERNGAVAASLGVRTAPDLRWAYGINPYGEPDMRDAGRLDEATRARITWPNRWPPDGDNPEFRPTWLAYYRAVEELALRLLRLMAVDLGLPADWFVGFHRAHASNLVANYYPAQPERPADDQYRIGEHHDWGSITVLYQDGQPGLQVVGKDGDWHGVPAVPGTFVVNLGDMMAAWTGGEYASTRHRVLNPPRSRAGVPRVSIPFFGEPDPDAVVATPEELIGDGRPRIGPVVAGEWFADKLASVRAAAG